MRIMLTTWQLSRCPLLRRGGQVRVLQKVLNRFNGHRLQWYFGQRLSHIFSLLNEIGYFAIKFRHKASHLIFVALGNKFCRFPDVIPSLSDVLFILFCQLLIKTIINITRKQVPKEGRSTWVCRRRRGRVCWRRCATSRSPGCQGQSSETWARERSLSENICTSKGTMFGGGDV